MNALTTALLNSFQALNELTGGTSPAGSTRPEVLEACAALASAAAAWIAAGGPDRADPELRDTLQRVWAMRSAPPLRRVQEHQQGEAALMGLPTFIQGVIAELPARARAELARCQSRIRGSHALDQVLHDTLGIPPRDLDPMGFACSGLPTERSSEVTRLLLDVLKGTAEARSLPELTHLWSWWGAVLSAVLLGPLDAPLWSVQRQAGGQQVLEVYAPRGRVLMLHLSWPSVPPGRHQALQRSVYTLITVLLAAPAAEEV